MMSLEELLRERPVNRAQVDAHKRRMSGEVRAYQLRELREASELTHVELAGEVGESQNRVLRIEHGNIELVQGDL